MACNVTANEVIRSHISNKPLRGSTFRIGPGVRAPQYSALGIIGTAAYTLEFTVARVAQVYASFAECLMWARVNRLSPLDDGSRIKPV
jgi:hypothetical protein